MKFNIMQKLLIIVAPPIVTLLLFSASFINEKYITLKENRLELVSLEIIEKSSYLIHEIQMERGLTSSCLQEDSSEYFHLELLKQRKNTDTKMQKFIEILHKTDKKNLSLLSLTYMKDIEILLNNIQNIRELIDTKRLRHTDSFTFYTFINNQMIAILNSFKIHTSSKQTNIHISILQSIIQLEEYAGQERALVATISYSNTFAEKEIRELHNLMTSQKDEFNKINFLLKQTEYENELINIHESYKDSFYFSSKESILSYEKRQNELSKAVLESLEHIDREKIVALYQSFKDTPLNIDTKKWFDISSHRINKIHHLEDRFLEKISQDILQSIDKTYSSLKYQILLTVFTILLLLFLTFYIAKKITYSIAQLKKGMDDFFDFLNFKNKEAKIITTNSQDEINDIAQSINAQIITIEENIEEDENFIHEATQIVMLMKDGDFSERPYFEPYNPNLKELKSVLDELIELIATKIKEQTKSLERLNSSLEDRVFHQTLALEKQIEDITLARDEAIKAEIAKDEFLANMSHEIRTPLNAILGFVTILKKQITDETAVNYLNIIDTSGKSLLTIINDILDFSKIQSGKFNIAPYSFNPVEEFSDAVLLFASKAYEKHLLYVVYIDPNLPQSISADAVRIKQILSNILSNAIKFTPHDGSIKVTVTIKDSQLIISVQDSGIGIKEENLSKVFSAFEQADGSTTRKYGGTGLGLSISSQLASLMHGKLNLKSEIGHGSTFSLTLPIEILENTSLTMIDRTKIKEYTFAILNKCPLCTDQARLIKKYLKDFGATNIIELDEYQGEGYDILFFVPDDSFNEDIVNSSKLAIAILRTNYIKLANLTHIQALYAPFTPKALIQAINDTNIQNLQRVYETPAQEIEEELHFSGSILIAEDNKTNQMLISLILDDYGVEYTVVNNGLEAVEMFKENSYDLVLMDENMPELNGIGAMKLIKEYEKNAKMAFTPIIALTASVLEADKEMFINVGMDGFIGKPIDTQEIEREFKKYLKRV